VMTEAGQVRSGKSMAAKARYFVDGLRNMEILPAFISKPLVGAMPHRVAHLKVFPVLFAPTDGA
jgi:hypothetical protein